MPVDGFKITKRGGWQWRCTSTVDPERAERLWLAIATATLWLLSVGGAGDPSLPISLCPEPALVIDTQRHVPKQQRRATRLRLVSIFRRGWFCLLAALLRHDALST